MKREGLYGLLAEFESVESLQRGATDLLVHGYRHVQIFSPHAVEELNGFFAGPISGTVSKLIAPAVFTGGAGGAIAAFVMQEYANIADDPMNLGGKPHNSWPAFIPITFELTILGAALAAFVVFLLMNRLPSFHHPIFNAERFERATQDRYFICVEERDGHFEREKTAELLLQHATAIEEVSW